MNPANKKMHLILSNFKTGIDAAAHATLDTKYTISCIRTALVDIIASPQESDRGVIPVLEVHELLTHIYGQCCVYMVW